MSKGYKPTEKNRPPVSTIDVGGSGSGGGINSEVKSWQFALVDKTVFAALAKVGTAVTGIPKGNDVFIRNGLHVYGFAPSDVAFEIIEAMHERKGKLVGNVTSVTVNQSNLSETDVWVQISLR
jgi:hypothetical protein